MIKSFYPAEQELGLRYYVSDTPGIGGTLKSVPEDFLVDEIPVHEIHGDGDYLICKLTKKNWELQRAVKEISKVLGISHQRIGWGGTKDKRAVTTQWISFYRIAPDQIERINMKDITLDVIGISRTPLSLGDLKGNIFSVNIRDCKTGSLQENVENTIASVRQGIPNYYGIQRFGVIRPVTHLVGIEMLKGNYEEAVKCYAGYACEGEPEEIYNARKDYYDTGDVKEALHNLPVHLRYERSMLHHLVKKPDDYKGALMNIPPKLLSMFVSAYQSHLFNLTLSMRMENGIPLTEPVPGDRLLFENGKEDIVTEKNRRIAALHIKRGRCAIAIYMPGSLDYSQYGPMDAYISELLSKSGITKEGFKKVSEITKSRFNGALRKISVSTDIDYNITDDMVSLKFPLPPGHYATTICREFMKADPLKMI